MSPLSTSSASSSPWLVIRRSSCVSAVLLHCLVLFSFFLCFGVCARSCQHRIESDSLLSDHHDQPCFTRHHHQQQQQQQQQQQRQEHQQQQQQQQQQQEEKKQQDQLLTSHHNDNSNNDNKSNLSGGDKDSLSLKHNITDIIRLLRPVISTPWQPLPKPTGTYFIPPSMDMSSHPPPQIHAGDVLDHSLWASVYMSRILDGTMSPGNGFAAPLLTVALQKILVFAAFVHDIGKGLHCAFRCMAAQDGELRCWQDAYSTFNYQSVNGIDQHPLFSARFITGETVAYWPCPNEAEMREIWLSSNDDALRLERLHHILYDHALVINSLYVLSDLQLSQHSQLIAFLLAGHWEFGKTNIRPSIQGYEHFIRFFVSSANQYHIEPSLVHLHMLMLMGITDLLASDRPDSLCQSPSDETSELVRYLCRAVCTEAEIQRDQCCGAKYEGIGAYLAYNMHHNVAIHISNAQKCFNALIVDGLPDCSTADIDLTSLVT